MGTLTPDSSTAAPAGHPTVGPQACSMQTTNGPCLTAAGGGGLSSGGHALTHIPVRRLVGRSGLACGRADRSLATGDRR